VEADARPAQQAHRDGALAGGGGHALGLGEDVRERHVGANVT
jgi:hypothetical protein